MSGEDRAFFAQALRDAVASVSEMVEPLRQDIQSIQRDIRRLDKIEAEMMAVKAALKETNIDIRCLEKKVLRIEEKVEGFEQQLGNTHAMAYDALRLSKLQEQRMIENETRTV